MLPITGRPTMPAEGGDPALFLLPLPGNEKSGFPSSNTWFGSAPRTGRRGGMDPGYPIGIGGGCQRGLTPRWEMDVKLERSDSAGERAPGGMSS